MSALELVLTVLGAYWVPDDIDAAFQGAIELMFQ